MPKTSINPIASEIARLESVEAEQTTEFLAADEQIKRAAAARNGLHATRHDKDQPSLDPDDYAARTNRYGEAIGAGNRRQDSARRALADARPKLARLRDLAAQIERAQPVDEAHAAWVAARALPAQIEAQIAAAREQRLAAIAVQSADGLNAANQRLRDLPAELSFARQNAIAAEIALHDAQVCALAPDIWAAELRADAAANAVADAEQEHRAAIDASRVLANQRARASQRISQLQTEATRLLAALSAA